MYYLSFFVSCWICGVVVLSCRSSIIEKIMYRTRTMFAAATAVIAAYVEFPRIRVRPRMHCRDCNTVPKVFQRCEVRHDWHHS